jgi:hypothetical protein
MNDLDGTRAPSTGRELVTRTYNVPLTLPGGFRELVSRSGATPSCKRGMLVLYKDACGSILRAIQRDINKGCREKSKVLEAALAGKLEQPPSKSNTYYRDLFNDSSKLGEVSTYIVKNTAAGQHEHLFSKLPAIREMLLDSPLSTIAPFIVCNHVVNYLRKRVVYRFNWKLSHVRPQLRGMRRLLEERGSIDASLQLMTKNDEFSRLREGIDKMLDSSPASASMDLDIVDKILDKFQKGHVLHVLLLSRGEIRGVCPRVVKIGGVIRDGVVMEKQLELLISFCKDHRDALEGLVKDCITGLVRLSEEEVFPALDEATREHDEYFQFLKVHGYGTWHAKRKREALNALRSNAAWVQHVGCGVVPSERFIKHLSRLVNAMPGIKVKTGDALRSVIPTAHVTKLASIEGCGTDAFLSRFINGLTADACTRFPFTSARNRKELSPVDLTPINNHFLILRPGKVANDLLDDYLRKGKPVPLGFAPGKVIEFYTGSKTGKLDERMLKDRVSKVLARKGYKPRDIETILDMISFNGVPHATGKSLSSRVKQFSPLARHLLDSVLEIDLFSNKRLGKGLQKVKDIIKDPDVTMSPIRILPVNPMNNAVTCQLIFSSKGVTPAFRSRVAFMKDIKIGTFKKELKIGIDVNKENEHRIYAAPDWRSSERYIKEHELERKLGRPVYNEDKDKEFTAYVHDGRTSMLVSDHINSLSGALKDNLVHLNKLKKVKKKVQGACSKRKFKCITDAARFYQAVVNLAMGAGLEKNAAVLRDAVAEIKDLPKNEVHALRDSREHRNGIIEDILVACKEKNEPRVQALQREFNRIREAGKHVHKLETELGFITKKMNDLRKEIEIKLAQLLGMLACEIHPAELVHEELNVKHQGLKGALGEITKYMPRMGSFITKAAEIAGLHAEFLGVSLQTMIRGVHPGGSSSPPHIPTNLDFKRGGRNGWHVITIPPTMKVGIQYPELKINSHLLSCQKLCAKASGS